MKALIDLIPLFIFLSILLALYLNLIQTYLGIETEIKIVTNEIKCRTILLNLKFENLSEEELLLLEKVNNADCNFSTT
jgi:hypothetical protein